MIDSYEILSISIQNFWISNSSIEIIATEMNSAIKAFRKVVWSINFIIMIPINRLRKMPYGSGVKVRTKKAIIEILIIYVILDFLVVGMFNIVVKSSILIVASKNDIGSRINLDNVSFGVVSVFKIA